MGQSAGSIVTPQVDPKIAMMSGANRKEEGVEYTMENALAVVIVALYAGRFRHVAIDIAVKATGIEKDKILLRIKEMEALFWEFTIGPSADGADI